MNWTCEQIEERLSEYLDRLLPPAERAGFAAHVESCAVCRPLVARVEALVGSLHRLAPAEPSAQLVPRILEQTAEAPRGWRARLPGWLRPVAQPRFAVGLATAALALVFILQGMGVDVRNLTLADMHPKNIYNVADRQAHLLYARGAKFVNDLRVVYEIQSRLAPSNPPEAEGEEQPQSEDDSDRERSRPQNRADEVVGPNYTVLAMLLPGRSF